MNKTDLNKKKKKELLDIAKKNNIPVSSSLKKAEIIDALLLKKTDSKPAKSISKTSTKKSNIKSKVKSADKKESALTDVDYEDIDDSQFIKKELQSIDSRQEQTFPLDQYHELPQGYNETKLIAIVRDPYWIYVYWDIASPTIEFVQNIYRRNNGIRSILRVHDITDIEFSGDNSNYYWDTDIILDARNWYLNINDPNRVYVVDLALVDNFGNYYLIARSNIFRMPLDGPSHIIDERWMTVDFDEIYEISGGKEIGLSSGEVRKRRAQIWEQEWLSSGALSSPIRKLQIKEKLKDFFLEVNTELIIYGRTESDAELTVAGKKIPLRPDGTFTLRYALPDGNFKYPVKAVSNDKMHKRSVSIAVGKGTK